MRMPPSRRARTHSMSTATPASIPPRCTAAINAGWRPTCFVIANASTPTRAASCEISRALASTASRSSTNAAAGIAPCCCSRIAAETNAGLRRTSASRNT